MKIQIDLKSAVSGLIIGIVAMFVMGSGSSSNDTGRYRLEAAQSYALVIDTQTGQVWGASYANTAQYRSDGNFYTPKNQ